MTWDEMRSLPITAADIERARAAGACGMAIDWAMSEPRMWGDARQAWIGWFGRHAATPAQISACIEGTNAVGCGLIGVTRRHLTPEQIEACIAGTDAWGRGLIRRHRSDLTPAQRAACEA